MTAAQHASISSASNRSGLPASSMREHASRKKATITAQHTRPNGAKTPSFARKLKTSMAQTGRYADHVLDICYTNDPSAVDAFCEVWLSEQTCLHLGFDLEHRPTFKPGSKPNVALLQFAPQVSPDASVHPILLFSLFHANAVLPQSLHKVLASSSISKHGVGIKADSRLLAYLGLAPQSLQSFRELETDIKLAMPDYSGGRGLKALINNLMDEPCTRLKTKKITMSNWEMRKLSDDQLAYAAMDALCGMMLWEIIDAKRGKQGYD